jgi:uncharacterized membrane protein YdjX (TVP38/TMEM64 family)
MHAIIVTGCSRCLRIVPVSHLNFAAGLTEIEVLVFQVCVFYYILFSILAVANAQIFSLFHAISAVTVCLHLAVGVV